MIDSYYLLDNNINNILYYELFIQDIINIIIKQFYLFAYFQQIKNW
jgi:hypothetical protein